MKIARPFKFLAALLIAVVLTSLVSVTNTKSNYTESFPAVVCPPTLVGLSSQISLASKKTLAQPLASRTIRTAPVKVLRLPVPKDSLVITSEGATPVVWQSRANSWAGGALCTGPAPAQWFVGGTADITSRGRLIIINSGLSDAVVEIQAFSENGKQPLKTINISSKNFQTISLDSLAPGDKKLAVQVKPQSGRINSFMIDEQGKGLRALGGDFVNPVNRASKSLLIPAIPNKSLKKGQKATFGHTFRVLTPGEVDTNVTVEVLSADGVFTPVGFNSRAISAGQVTEFILAPNISASAFAIRVSATEPILASVRSSVVLPGGRDFLWSTPTPALTELTTAITGLTPLVVFAGDKIDVSLAITLVNGKVTRETVTGTEIATWRPPADTRSVTITKAGQANFAGALVSSVNGYGYFPIAPGSVLTKSQTPDSNIRVLTP